jgi:hypothetical protein
MAYHRERVQPHINPQIQVITAHNLFCGDIGDVLDVFPKPHLISGRVKTGIDRSASSRSVEAEESEGTTNQLR